MTEHQHGPDCDHENEEAVFVITDEEGVEQEYIMVYSFETERGQYAVLLKKDDLESDGLLLKIEQEDGEAFLIDIEDEEEWNHALKVYESAVAEQQGQ
jgi:uncharacterized protein YrzB (UPF0473 family)